MNREREKERASEQETEIETVYVCLGVWMRRGRAWQDCGRCVVVLEGAR